jgi:hypothetical protein
MLARYVLGREKFGLVQLYHSSSIKAEVRVALWPLDATAVTGVTPYIWSDNKRAELCRTTAQGLKGGKEKGRSGRSRYEIV